MSVFVTFEVVFVCNSEGIYYSFGCTCSVFASIMSLLFFHSQTSLSSAKAGGRCMAKEFVFDHSYWSVQSTDDHYADQEMVSRMTLFTAYSHCSCTPPPDQPACWQGPVGRGRGMMHGVNYLWVM